MKIRVTDATASLVRVQVDENVTYVQRKSGLSAGNGQRDSDHAYSTIPVFRPNEPVFEADGCKVFVQPFADRTDLVVIWAVRRALANSAA